MWLFFLVMLFFWARKMYHRLQKKVRKKKEHDPAHYTFRLEMAQNPMIWGYGQNKIFGLPKKNTDIQ